jgi:ABC-type Fe3+-siderophore transport system permease subunit
MEIPRYISGSIFVAILFRYALVWAAKLHLAVAAVLAAVLAIGAIWLIARVKRSQAFKEISLVVPY